MDMDPNGLPPHGQTQPSAETAEPTIIHVESSSKRLPLWILSAVVVGFLLPMCACGMLFMVSLTGLGAAGLATEPIAPAAFTESVAIIAVDGTIINGSLDEFTPGSAVSGVVINDLRSAEADPLVKAIVLHVDSPGGGVTGSAQIHEVIEQLEKPIVVSMESLAASGGYYVSAPADYIFARADTWTGSIGVIVQIVNAEGLFEEYGIEANTITSGENKAFGGLFEALTPEQEAIMQELVDESFNEFVNVIVSGRGMTRQEVLALADGRIYSGRQALDNGLVDELGNLEAAIAKAAELGGIEGEPGILEYEHVPNLFNTFMGFSAKLTQSESEKILSELEALTTPKVEYRYVGN